CPLRHRGGPIDEPDTPFPLRRGPRSCSAHCWCASSPDGDYPHFGRWSTNSESGDKGGPSPPSSAPKDLACRRMPSLPRRACAETTFRSEPTGLQLPGPFVTLTQYHHKPAET